MNAHIVFGIFALYVAAVSLWMVLVGQQDAVLALFRQLWGRTIGYSLYFVARVALPMLICVLCLGWGIRQFDSAISFHPPILHLQLNVEYYQDLRLMFLMDNVPDPVGIVYGA